jgi:hypothetical protein
LEEVGVVVGMLAFGALLLAGFLKTFPGVPLEVEIETEAEPKEAAHA